MWAALQWLVAFTIHQYPPSVLYTYMCKTPWGGQINEETNSPGKLIFLHASVQQDYADTQMLLSSENVNQEALLCYAREAADFGTNYQLPTLDFAMNHCGQPDVAMFDFTNMYASENAALVRERFGHQLLVALVGDSLLEVNKDLWSHNVSWDWLKDREWI